MFNIFVEQPETTAVLFTMPVRFNNSSPMTHLFIRMCCNFFKDQLVNSFQNWVFFLCCKTSSIFLEIMPPTFKFNSSLPNTISFIYSFTWKVLTAYYLLHSSFSDHHVNICLPSTLTGLLAYLPLTLSFYILHKTGNIFLKYKYDFYP